MTQEAQTPQPDTSLRDALGAFERTVTLNGKPITVRPMTIRKIQAVQAAIGPLMEAAKGRSFSDETLLDLAIQHTDELLEVLAAGIGLPVDDLDVEPDELVLLSIAFVGVNSDFFTQRLAPVLPAPMLLALLGRMGIKVQAPAPKAEATGSTPYSD
jgi:hypothetical protein